MNVIKYLFSRRSGRCVCCAYPTQNKLFPTAHAFICPSCADEILTIPRHIQMTHTLYQSIFTYGVYQGILQEIIPQYKYEAKLYYAPLLADILLFTIQSLITTQYTYCIPVPQHQKKIRVRGFYHLGLLANYITRYISIPILTTCIQITREYPSQQTLSKEERVQNLQNVFHAQYPLHGAYILILDDVITTGATVHALAQELHNAGATHIDCLSIAINKRGIL